MAGEKDGLIRALAERGKVAGFFNNLEKLNSSEEIGPQLYSFKREEYMRRHSALSLEISNIKGDIQTVLAEAGRSIAARSTIKTGFRRSSLLIISFLLYPTG